jgi:hypothetical protein
MFSAEFSKSQLNFSKVSGIGFGPVDGNLRLRALALREKNGNLTNSHWSDSLRDELIYAVVAVPA